MWKYQFKKSWLHFDSLNSSNGSLVTLWADMSSSYELSSCYPKQGVVSLWTFWQRVINIKLIGAQISLRCFLLMFEILCDMFAYGFRLSITCPRWSASNALSLGLFYSTRCGKPNSASTLAAMSLMLFSYHTRKLRGLLCCPHHSLIKITCPVPKTSMVPISRMVL